MPKPSLLKDSLTHGWGNTGPLFLLEPVRAFSDTLPTTSAQVVPYKFLLRYGTQASGCLHY